MENISLSSIQHLEGMPPCQFDFLPTADLVDARIVALGYALFDFSLSICFSLACQKNHFNHWTDLKTGTILSMRPQMDEMKMWMLTEFVIKLMSAGMMSLIESQSWNFEEWNEWTFCSFTAL